MTYVPVPTGPSGPVITDNDHRDLLTAIRLLSGYECKRDASQAQVLLVSLSESRHPEVAEDASSILKRGLTYGWFDNTEPRYSELERMAERSIKTYRTGPGDLAQRRIMWIALATGLAAMVGFLAFFEAENGSAGEGPQHFLVLGGLILAAIVGLLVVFMKRRAESGR